MKPMLACKWDPDIHESMFPFWAQPKLDGIRILIGSDGYAYTRSLKPVRNIELQSLIRHTPVLRGLDAEIIVGDKTAPDCYRRTSSAVMSYENSDISNMSLQVFDVWQHSESNYDNRYSDILSLMDQFPDWVEVVQTVLVSDLKMLEEYETKWLNQGYEGVILRRRDTPYKYGRSSPKKGELIKLKRFADAEGVIVACHEEMHNANPATINELGYTEHSGHKENLIGKGTLGAFEVKHNVKNLTSEFVRIGTGLSAQQRQLFWEKRSELIGKIVKFKYFEVGVKDAPRFPVFLGFRDPDDMQGELF
ncbi:MAG: putative DNA ligase [Prokaryotic dsDNA virus sp.]|jgi:DNA ligase-1|nr:ATP-dependent DNA ligase [Flavobacteriaceae bacterium]QDP65315.1 MAG: putative DNA ligase [Prokaryotic dsDNA virus sp.]|tara:strand:+ start:1518 stop:2435 length:918 start_codon:yes stop_codon:yes gene_type:complete